MSKTSETSHGIALVLAERKRQITIKGHTPESDLNYEGCELSAAALSYLEWSVGYKTRANMHWPFPFDSFRPHETNDRNLVKAGALIIAELDRRENLRQRSKSTTSNGHEPYLANPTEGLQR